MATHRRGAVRDAGLAKQVSELNHQLYDRIEAWRNQPIEGRFAYVYLDDAFLGRRGEKRGRAGGEGRGPGRQPKVLGFRFIGKK